MDIKQIVASESLVATNPKNTLQDDVWNVPAETSRMHIFRDREIRYLAIDLLNKK